MPKTISVERSKQLQHFIELIGSARNPFLETGRKFDKIYVDGTVRYFVSRMEQGDINEGDIFGAKSKLAPNRHWYFGNIVNVDNWNWSGKYGIPVNDPSVVVAKSYKDYVHYRKVTLPKVTQNS